MVYARAFLRPTACRSEGHGYGQARWGWVFSRDVAEGSIDAFLGDGIVHVEKDRWIRTYTREGLQELLKEFHILKI